MSRNRFLQVFFAGLALLAGTGKVYATASPLSATVTTVSITATKPSTAGSGVTSDISVASAAPSQFFTVDPTSIPVWLKVSPTSGVAVDGTPVTLTFSPSPAWVNLGSGSFSGTVNVNVTGFAALPITVKLTISDPTPTLTVKGGTTVLNAVNWTINSASPALSFTLISPIPTSFSAVASSTATTNGGVADWLTFSSSNATSNDENLAGMAYSWGTSVGLSINPLALQLAHVGDTLTGQVVVNTSITIPVIITVMPPSPTITSLNPTSVPVMGSATGTILVVINGTNFVPAGTPTSVYVSTGTTAFGTAVTAGNVQVLSTNTIVLSLAYDSTNQYLKLAGTLNIGVANGSSPTAPALTSTSAVAKLTVTTAPIISSITSASTFLEPATGVNPTVAPYDVVSIFGTNFCAGCSATLVGSPDAWGRYPTYLTPDSTGTLHKITVTFTKVSGTGSFTSAPGYLLFATNNQINVLVPGAVPSGMVVKAVVGYDTAATPTTANSSAPYNLAIVAADPGVFTLASNGVGQGAILNQDYTINSSSAPAHAADVVMIYMTGLGVPNSTGTNASGQSCIAPLGVAGTASAVPTGYMGTVNTGTSSTGYTVPSGYTAPATTSAWTSIDGAVIMGKLLTSNSVGAPCFVNAGVPTVTIGGLSATVGYAGWVSDSIAGLYQVNVTIPDLTSLGLSAATDEPVVVTIGAASSQVGATISVQ